jgi:chemotaxis protein MotB
MAVHTKKTVRVRTKKVRHHGGHHGGSWKVAYADFVTAMMALFLVLWLVSQGDQKLKQAIANYFRAPGAFETAQGNIFQGKDGTDNPVSTSMATKDDEEALFNTAALLKKRLSQLASNDQIKIDMTEEGLHIQILDKADQVSFQLGSAQLANSTREILAQIAVTICELPNPIQIGGHTDSYTFPSEGYTNWELSADRANAARRELINNCVNSERIRRIVGYADTMLLVPEDPYAPANRRISIMVMWQTASAARHAEKAELVEPEAPK